MFTMLSLLTRITRHLCVHYVANTKFTRYLSVHYVANAFGTVALILAIRAWICSGIVSVDSVLAPWRFGTRVWSWVSKVVDNLLTTSPIEYRFVFKIWVIVPSISPSTVAEIE